MERQSYTQPLSRIASVLVTEHILTASHEGMPVDPVDPEIIE